jgi:peptide/nickel transport system ATP-binding protein
MNSPSRSGNRPKGHVPRNSLLEMQNLQMYYFGPKGRIVYAVDRVDLRIHEQEVVGLVGESGCGKSATGLSLMRLVPSQVGRIVGGRILFQGKDLVQLSESRIRKIRGKEIAMIFQDPMIALNPTYKVAWQIGEAIAAHEKLSRRERRRRIIELLEAVGIPAPEKRADEYPHQLSGGMRQRVMIASALSCRPRMLIADEPTTALDVTVQRQIMDLLRSLKDRFQMSMLLISHDLGVVAEIAQRVAVMYAGQIVEEAPAEALFEKPLHPYTEALLEAIPSRRQPKSRLKVIPGRVPDMSGTFAGCRFCSRCSYVREDCRGVAPELFHVGDNRWVRCLRISWAEPSEGTLKP